MEELTPNEIEKLEQEARHIKFLTNLQRQQQLKENPMIYETYF